jgi:hypothetical protein
MNTMAPSTVRSITGKEPVMFHHIFHTTAIRAFLLSAAVVIGVSSCASLTPTPTDDHEMILTPDEADDFMDFDWDRTQSRIDSYDDWQG